MQMKPNLELNGSSVIEDKVVIDTSEAPYSNYSPIPGVIPATNPPTFIKDEFDNKTEKCVVTANQPIIPVPLVQPIHHKETIVEVEQVVLTDKIQPKIFKQDVYHEVPKVAVDVREVKVDVPFLKIKEVPTVVDVPVGFNFNVEASWKDRVVPRIFPKYCGKQEVIPIYIPQIEIIDKKEENEVPIYIGEKYVETEVIEEVGNEVVSYKYVLKHEDVPVIKYRPVFDVEVAIPPPVLVPIPVEPHEINVSTQKLSWVEFQKQRKLKKKLKCLAPRPSVVQQDSVEPSEPPAVMN